MPDSNVLINTLTVGQASYLLEYYMAKAVAIFIVIFITIKFISLFRFGTKR